MCQHQPPCPPADSPNRHYAKIVVEHWIQGWCRLCNGVVLFDDGGELVWDLHTARALTASVSAA
ncbi:MAG TPA: DUF5999 family protein [Kribbellaceae bacterium]|jgi:hypothetical protein